MEQKREGQTERSGPRFMTRTFLFYSKNDSTFVGKVCKALGMQYLAVKVGGATHIEGVNVPLPRATIIMVGQPCAIKIVERDVTTYFMISETGIETRQGRWGNYKFENVETTSKFCKLQVGNETVEESVRIGKASGVVQPYTEEEMADVDLDLELPGLSLMNLESDQVSEMREQLKAQREQRRTVLGSALKEIGATKGLGRLVGVRPEVSAQLGAVKKLTGRVQGKMEEVPKPQRLLKSPFGPITKMEAKPEQKLDEPARIAEVLRMKSQLQAQLQAPVPPVDTLVELEDKPVLASASDITTLLERMKTPVTEVASGFSPIMKIPATESPVTPFKPKKMEASPSIMQSPIQGFKLNDEYLTLADSVHKECLSSDIGPAEMSLPLKLGSFEKCITTYSFPRGGLLPIFNVNLTSCEYAFAGFEAVNKAMIVSSGGSLVILPIY
ncbi:NS2 [CHeRI orbivirus 3-3]|uniref:Non-structural protein NS2 n=1 Tax=CHeRI orbivirus 3-4 TaxID=2729576 RepID=A0A6M3SLL9_9REOV|nr:NS2 [CHeRI orbivirus 3-3]QJD38997.1 NS2 [CHeRI orbivirus 3-4]